MKTADFVIAKRPHLAAIDRFPHVDFSDYEHGLTTAQETLQRIQQAYLGTHERAVIVLEGWDTAGKGGVVRRLGWALDPRSFKVHTIAAPEEREKSLHYLQRFWERLPRHGQIVAFDRSWYGRVLVERVEGFAAVAEWRRAYEEINEFERMLIADGARLVKLFLHITPDEQMRRFRNRLANPLKRWKLSYEDFRNRGRWKEYETAIEDMMEKTSPRRAPWHLIPANDKPYGRLAALKIIVDRLSKDLSLEPRPLDPKILDAAESLLGLRLPPQPNGRRPARSPTEA
jgi:AMP-polyphosphate phosphotransferase